MTHTGYIMTAEELERLPHDLPCELIRGELIFIAPAGPDHGYVSANCSGILRGFVKQHGLGRVFGAKTGFIIARKPDTVRAPDASFIRADRDVRVARGFFPGVPDLAVEVVSPGDTQAAAVDKARMWIDAGTPLVWLVWPGPQAVTVLRPGEPDQHLAARDTITGEPVLPGFSVRVGEFFE